MDLCSLICLVNDQEYICQICRYGCVNWLTRSGTQNPYPPTQRKPTWGLHYWAGLGTLAMEGKGNTPTPSGTGHRYIMEVCLSSCSLVSCSMSFATLNLLPWTFRIVDPFDTLPPIQDLGLSHTWIWRIYSQLNRENIIAWILCFSV